MKNADSRILMSAWSWYEMSDTIKGIRQPVQDMSKLPEEIRRHFCLVETSENTAFLVKMKNPLTSGIARDAAS